MTAEQDQTGASSSSSTPWSGVLPPQPSSPSDGSAASLLKDTEALSSLPRAVRDAFTPTKAKPHVQIAFRSSVKAPSQTPKAGHNRDDDTAAEVSGISSFHIKSRKAFVLSTAGGWIPEPELAVIANNLPWFICNPYGRFRKCWDSLILLCLVFIAIGVPLRLGLDDQTEPDSFLFAWDRIIDAIFLADLVLNFFTAVDKDGELLYGVRDIAVSYARGWLLLDFVSSVPLDLIFFLADSSSQQAGNAGKLVKILKIARLARLLRLGRVTRIMNRIESYFNIQFAVLSICKFVLVVLVLAHWLACAFLFVRVWEDSEENWLDSNTSILERYKDSDGHKYIVAIYYAFMTMTTIGYGDIHPVTSWERVLSCFAMAMGGVIFTFGITNIVQLVSGMNANRLAARRQMDNLTEYFEYRQLPSAIANEVRQFFKYRQNNRFFKEKELLVRMSPDLRSKVVHHVNRKLIASVPFFRNVKNPLFISELMLRMDYACAAPNETIVKEKAVGENMYILSKGRVKVESLANGISRTMYPGDFFGEIALLMKVERTATVTAETWCDFLTLSRADFNEIVALFPGVRQRVLGFAKHRIANPRRNTISVPTAQAAKMLATFGQTEPPDNSLPQSPTLPKNQVSTPAVVVSPSVRHLRRQSKFGGGAMLSVPGANSKNSKKNQQQPKPNQNSMLQLVALQRQPSSATLTRSATQTLAAEMPALHVPQIDSDVARNFSPSPARSIHDSGTPTLNEQVFKQDQRRQTAKKQKNKPLIGAKVLDEIKAGRNRIDMLQAKLAQFEAQNELLQYQLEERHHRRQSVLSELKAPSSPSSVAPNTPNRVDSVHGRHASPSEIRKRAHQILAGKSSAVQRILRVEPPAKRNSPPPTRPAKGSVTPMPPPAVVSNNQTTTPSPRSRKATTSARLKKKSQDSVAQRIATTASSQSFFASAMGLSDGPATHQEALALINKQQKQ